MNNKFLLPLLSSVVLIFIISADSFAQNDNNDMQGETTITHKKNVVKINLPALLLKNYSIQYERVLSRKISFALGYRVMPNTSLPLQKSILSLIGDDDSETEKTIRDLRLSNFAITPELRIYLSRKGYGRGFYFAPFYRFASFKTNDLNFFYSTSNNTENNIKLSGKLTSNTGGFLLGVQKFLGKRIILDTWIFGPHYGSGKGELTGITSKPLTPDEQAALRDELESIDIPLTDKTVNVNANGASVKLDGPWAGFRAGLSLGIRF
jgi:hypothetical protein